MGNLFRQIKGVPCIIRRHTWNGQTILDVEVCERHKESQIYAVLGDGVDYATLLLLYRTLRNKITKLVGDFIFPPHPGNMVAHNLSLALPKKKIKRC